MNLQERLQQLAVERQNLTIALHEVNGAMKILEQQILEIITIASVFNFVNRFVDALGTELEDNQKTNL